jgi:enamine deaminase RidA (YjgF/YER057c/UK114 family)
MDPDQIRVYPCYPVRGMAFTLINPDSLGSPSGYSNGLLVDSGGKLLFIAGQIAWDADQKIVSDDLVEQFDKALANVITVLNAANGQPNHVARLIIYVTDKMEYRKRRKEVGERYRNHMGKHFPAMVLVQVAGLLDDAAKVEIEGIAVIPA